MTTAPLDLAALRRLCEEATEGPWFVAEEPTHGGLSVVEDGRTAGLFPIACEASEAAFIAAARTALPALLDRVERAEREGEALRRHNEILLANYRLAFDRVQALESKAEGLREALDAIRERECSSLLNDLTCVDRSEPREYSCGACIAARALAEKGDGK
jgi:hypothetical protein